MLREWYAADEEETIRAGQEVAASLQPPMLVLLDGPLGAGKTTLMKGVAEALGAAERDDVSSPTFTLVQEYTGERARIFHLDVYRLETERELAGLGLEEMLEEPHAFVFVEWGEKFASLRGLSAYTLELSPAGAGRRIVLHGRRSNAGQVEHASGGLA